ncbi:hypothetical protein T8T21_00860 [Limimaricola variabilis]|uniref:hypothetical protein n=1 Tax=Limimaricola variabilis TaxID=1492771 RepID=UPI002AC8B93E|nr:hypothetical protein [Limimaricola variabilis]WPY94709.1 hypothetical protein T8T21_00860 [Limimaricola variabilis]
MRRAPVEAFEALRHALDSLRMLDAGRHTSVSDAEHMAAVDFELDRALDAWADLVVSDTLEDITGLLVTTYGRAG